MKKENFIKTVISHIADTTRKAEVLAEFNDHLKNKSAYFEELGYEKEPAAEKAEQALGDMDDACAIGEQLDAIKKPHRIVRALLLIASLVLLCACFILLFFVFGGGLVIDFRTPSPNFITFMQVQLLWILCMGLLCLCRHFHAVAGMLLCIPSALILIVGHVMNPVYAFKALLHFENVGELLYYTDFGGYTVNSGTTGIFLSLVIGTVVIVPTVTAVVLEVKKRNLTFSHLDMVVQRAVKAVFITVFALSAVFTVAVSVVTLASRETVIQRTATAMGQMDTFILTHMDEILSEDKTVAREQLQQTFPHMKVGKDLDCGTAGMRFYTYKKGDKTYFKLYTVLQDMQGFSIEISDAQLLEQAKVCDKTDIRNLPKPYALAVSQSSYGAGDEGIVLDVFYSDTSYEYADEYEDELLDKMLYRYTQGRGFVYVNSAFRTVGKPYDYDAAHETALANALKNKIAHPERYSDFIECESEIYEKIFAVSYDEAIGQYQADMEVAVDYYTQIGGKIYSVMPEAIELLSVTYKIENGKAVILELWQPDDGDYYELSIKNRFSDTAYKAWEKIGYSDDFKGYEAMYHRIKKYCGKSPYAHILFIDQTTGDCEYYVYTAFGTLENELKRMHLDK